MNNRNQYLGMWILYVLARLLLDAGVQPGLRGPLVEPVLVGVTHCTFGTPCHTTG